MVRHCHESRLKACRSRWISLYYKKLKNTIIQSQIQDQQEDDDYDPESDLTSNLPLDMGTQFISLLSKAQRQKLKQQITGLPDYLFLSPKEKKAYFKNKLVTYKKDLDKEKNIVKHTHSKKVKFTEHIDVKKFDISKATVTIANSNIIKQKHSPLSVRTI